LSEETVGTPVLHGMEEEMVYYWRTVVPTVDIVSHKI
jgi:hypothetical protein